MKFFASLFFPAILSAILSLLLQIFHLLQPSPWWYSLLYFVLLNGILHFIFRSQANTENFTQTIIVVLVIKFLLSATLLVIYSFYNKAQLIIFSIQFIAHYVLFTIFEIRYLLYLITKKPKS